MPVVQIPNVTIEDYGSIVLLTPMNARTRKWVDDHVATEPWQWMGASLTVDPRYVLSLLDRMEADGFTVERPK